MKKKVMMMAWEIAKHAKAAHGGNARDYISESMKMAWTVVKAEAQNILEEKKQLKEQVEVNAQSSYGYGLQCMPEGLRLWIVLDLMAAYEECENWRKFRDTFVQEYADIFAGISKDRDKSTMYSLLEHRLSQGVCTCYDEKERKARQSAMRKAYRLRNGEQKNRMRIGVMTCSGESGLYAL